MSESSFMPEFIADIIKWERVQLIIAGRIRNFDPETTDFCLVNSENGEKVALNGAVRADKFIIKMNIITAYPERNLLPNGRWFINCVNRDTGVLFPLSAGNNLFSDEGYEDAFVGKPDSIKIGRFAKTVTKSSTVSYTASPVINDAGELGICSYLEKPPEPGKLRKHFNIIAKLFKPIKDFIFKKAFDASFAVGNRLFRHKGNRIIFTSDSRASLSGNMQNVYERMVERGLDSQFKISFAFKPNANARRSFSDKFRVPYLLGRADMVIIDDFNPTVKQCRFKPCVKVVQLWHACGAFKTVGFSRTGKPGGPFVTNDNHRVYTHAIASSEHVAQFYCEAFGMTQKQVYPTGVPRTDVFFDENYRSVTRERMFNELPETKGKRVIMFAPTFRGKGAKSGFYPLYMLDMNDIAEMCRRTNSIFVYKLHPFVHDRPEIPEQYKDVIIDCTDYREINDLLFITDLLITDYSSVIYEASILDIPMIFYAYDLNEYISSRDFYEPFESFVPGRIVSSFRELMNAIYEEEYEHEKVKPFCERNFEFSDSHSTDRVIDWIILGQPPEKYRS